jgi:putative acetyltransferase
MQDRLTMRQAEDSDSGQVATLIATCWVAYDGCILDIQGEEPILRAIASGFRKKGGQFWVCCRGDWVIGCVGVALTPMGHADAELFKMYVHPRQRRRGVARMLEQQAAVTAKAWGAKTLDLWTDTRFAEAHAFYASIGYTKTDRLRSLNDLSNTSEFHFIRTL